MRRPYCSGEILSRRVGLLPPFHSTEFALQRADFMAANRRHRSPVGCEAQPLLLAVPQTLPLGAGLRLPSSSAQERWRARPVTRRSAIMHHQPEQTAKNETQRDQSCAKSGRCVRARSDLVRLVRGGGEEAKGGACPVHRACVSDDCEPHSPPLPLSLRPLASSSPIWPLISSVCGRGCGRGVADLGAACHGHTCAAAVCRGRAARRRQQIWRSGKERSPPRALVLQQ